jgi:hypothetical protein
MRSLRIGIVRIMTVDGLRVLALLLVLFNTCTLILHGRKGVSIILPRRCHAHVNMAASARKMSSKSLTIFPTRLLAAYDRHQHIVGVRLSES